MKKLIAIAIAVLAISIVGAASSRDSFASGQVIVMKKKGGGGGGGAGAGATYLGKPGDGTSEQGVNETVSTLADHTWTSGSGVVAFVSWCNDTAVTGVDLAGQAFIKVPGASYTTGASEYCQAETWYLAGNTASATQAVVASWTNAGDFGAYPYIMALEFSNLKAGGADVATTKAKSSGTTQTTTAGAPAETGEVFAAFFLEWGDHATWTAGGSPGTWTKVEGALSAKGAYYLSSSTASHQCSFEVDSAADNNYYSLMVGIKTNP